MGYDFYCKNFYLSSEKVAQVFTFENDNFLLNYNSFCDILCTELGVSLKCPMNLKHKNVSRNTITFYLLCKINNDHQYKLSCQKDDVKKGFDLKFNVECTTDQKCEHKSQSEGRYLSRQKRDIAIKESLTMMPKAMRSRDIVNADPEQCQSGNITGIHPSRVYQKVRSEALAKNDRAINDLDDLTEELKYEQSIGRKFIQKIDLYPFSTILINEDNMKILKNELQSKRVIYINIDATGGILRKVSEAPLLHHTLILPVKANDANRSHVLINLGELITVDSCSFNIEYFLRFYKNKFLNITKENRMAQIFVTDKSFANINAIINSQNNMTLREYLDTTYQICIGNRNIEHLTLAMLCSSHITKNWKDEIKKHFQHLNKEEFFFICSLIGHSMTIEIYDDLANFLKLIIRLFCTPKKNLDYQSILNQIHHTLAMNKDCNMTNEDEQQIDTDDDLSILSSKTIYQSSPFFKFFNDFATQLIDEQFFQDESDDNPFYSTIFVKEFMKKSISLIPLWSASLPKLLLMHETYRRANNGYIEGYFGNLKSSLRSNTTIGKLGSIKIGRYIRFIKEKNKSDFKEVELKMPDHHMSRKRKQTDPTHEMLSAERDMWKGKTSEKTTVMYNQSTILQYLEKTKST